MGEKAYPLLVLRTGFTLAARYFSVLLLKLPVSILLVDSFSPCAPHLYLTAMMMEEAERALSSHRKRRGVARASIMRRSTCLRDLATNVEQRATLDHVCRMEQRL